MLVRVQSNWNSYVADKIVQWAMKRVWHFLINLNIYLSHINDSTSRQYLPKRYKNLYKNLYEKVLSCFIHNIQCPPTREWTRKLWYIYTIECCSARKKNGLLLHTIIWTQLKNIVLGEILIWSSRTGKMNPWRKIISCLWWVYEGIG